MQRFLVLAITLLIVFLAGCNKPASPRADEARPGADEARPGADEASRGAGKVETRLDARSLESAAPVAAAEAVPTADGGAVLPSGAHAKSAPAVAKSLPRKIIYTAEIALVTDELDKAGAALEARVKAVGGYVSNANRVGNRGAARAATWTVRIPTDQYDRFIADTEKLGELESSSRKADDVSEEFYDVQARLRNKRVEETRLLEVLKDATGKLSEVLEVEKELSRVREEIEQIEGRLRYLTDQTDLSTVTITLREEKNFAPDGPPTVATRLSRALFGSLAAMKETGIGLLILVAGLLPWVVPLGVIAFAARWLIKRKR